VVVVDDVDMTITHVIRGDDHLNNTPKQIHIYQALGFPVPKFAHLPMILGPDKTRLSKRHGATSVQAYRDMGYLPEALLNYLVRLGWSHGDQEVFTKEELIERFSLEAIGKSAAVFNPDKLLWINSQYIKDSSPEYISELLIPFLEKEGLVEKEEGIDREWLKRAVVTLQERSRTLLEMARSMRYYILEYVELDPKAREKFINEKTRPMLEDVRDGLAGLEDFRAEEIEKVFMALVERHNTKLGKIAQPVRVAITGNTVSPGIFEVLEIIGKERAIKRLDRAIEGI